MSALVFLAPGFEEIEAITVIDVLRRAEIPTVVAGLTTNPIPASRGTRHLADIHLADVDVSQNFEILVLPGGAEGARNLAQSARVGDWLQRQHALQGWIAAICAAPTALLAHGVLNSGQKLIAHPSVQSYFSVGQVLTEQRVVVAGKLITGLAAGAAMEFAYEMVRQLRGEETVLKINHGVLAKMV